MIIELKQRVRMIRSPKPRRYEERTNSYEDKDVVGNTRFVILHKYLTRDINHNLIHTWLIYYGNVITHIQRR